MKTDIRWKQRFQNFERSIQFLEKGLQIPNPYIIQKAGLIQFFEIGFELSWQLIKDYLEEKGFNDLKSPRDSIKKGFETGLIIDGHTWLKALESRNLTAHTYDEDTAERVENEIRISYYALLRQLYTKLKDEI